MAPFDFAALSRRYAQDERGWARNPQPSALSVPMS